MEKRGRKKRTETKEEEENYSVVGAGDLHCKTLCEQS